MSSIVNRVKYAVSEVGKHYDDRHWWHQRFEHRVVAPVQQHLADDGIDVMAEDWDILIILDACRTDLFEETADFDRFDEYRVVRSKGSCTPEWLEANFSGGEFGDTVYVAGNPWVSKKAPNAFHDIANIWLEEFDVDQSDIADAETLGEVGLGGITIPAEQVTERAIEVAERYSDKRLIVHYFQPHAPYIGNSDGTRKSDEKVDDDIHPGIPLKTGELTHEEVWREYRKNFEYAMHHALDLADAVQGKTVISSDHGEMFGERLSPIPIRSYAHTIGLRSPELVEVPWAVIDGDRREITSGGVNATDVDESVVDERLENLGYKP